MDNVTMARLLDETADLLEIDGGEQLSRPQLSQRSRCRTADYRRPRSWPPTDTARLLAIPGIGKSMAANIQAIARPDAAPARRTPGQIRRRPS